MKRTGDYYGQMEEDKSPYETPQQRRDRLTAINDEIARKKIEANRIKREEEEMALTGTGRAVPALAAASGPLQAARLNIGSLNRLMASDTSSQAGSKPSRIVRKDADEEPAGGAGGQAYRAGPRVASGFDVRGYQAEEDEESALAQAVRNSLRDSKAQQSNKQRLKEAIKGYDLELETNFQIDCETVYQFSKQAHMRQHAREAAESRKQKADQLGRPSKGGKPPSDQEIYEDRMLALVKKGTYTKMQQASGSIEGGETAHFFTIPDYNRKYYSTFLVFLCNQPLLENEKGIVKYLFDDFVKLDIGDIQTRHDFIAIVCPTFQQSHSNHEADIFDPRDRGILAQSAFLTNRYFYVIAVIISGIGCKLKDDYDVSVANERTFKQQVNEKNTHMLMRITRILTSTRLMGFTNLSDGLFRCLMVAVEGKKITVPPKTLVYWLKAVGRAYELQIAPAESDA